MTISRVVSIGAATFLLNLVLCAAISIPAIEKDIHDRTNQRLDIASLPQNLVHVSGRDVVLEGTIESSSMRESVVQAVREVEGVHRIEDRMQIPQQTEVERKPANERRSARVEIRFSGGDIVLHGEVASEIEHVRLLDIARRFAEGSPLHDRVDIVESLGSYPHFDALGVVLRVVSTVAQGGVRAEGSELTIMGKVPDESAKRSIIQLVRAAAPKLQVVNALEVVDTSHSIRGAQSSAGFEGHVADGANALNVSLQASIEGVLAENSVDFVNETTSLTIYAQRSLNRIAGLMLNAPNPSLEVAVHTVSLGDRDREKELSQKRAEAIVDYLAGRGVASSRLYASGYGSDVPTADGPERRVEFHVIAEE